MRNNTLPDDLNPTLTIDETISVLNEALRLSPATISDMILKRLTCTKELADHPTIQVSRHSAHNALPSMYEVGLLGIINGLFGVDAKGWGPIEAVVEDEKVIRVQRVEHWGMSFEDWRGHG